jgi:hypothetical protein
MTNYLLDTGINKGWQVQTKARAGWWGGLTRVASGGEGANEDVWGAPALRTSGILVPPHHFSSRFNAECAAITYIIFYCYYLVLQ